MYLIPRQDAKVGLSLLFRRSSSGMTPFEIALICGGGGKKQRQQRKEVMDIVETILAQYSTTNSTIPLNIGDVLITEVIDDVIRLSYVYFLMKRQPNAMIDMLHMP